MITQKLSITTEIFILGFVPPIKRQTNRLAIYNAMMEPYRLMNEDWKTRRDEELIRSKVTIQKASLEWYLNYLFDTELQRIYIQRNQAQGVPVGLNVTDEPGEEVEVGLNVTDEPAGALAVPLRGEDATVGLSRFAVFIPAALTADTEAIRGVVRNYNSSGKDFTIIEF